MKPTRYTFWLSKYHIDKLKAISKDKKISASELLRLLIDKAK